MKILLAEDTADLNKVLCAVLTHEGYDVTPCFDGEQAIERINNDGFDCLVLDIMMPKKDGIEVLREARSKNIVTPVIMLTAKSEIDDRVAGLDAGADMQLLILNPNRRVPCDYILQSIWSREPDAQADTVLLYISYLRRKLKAVASAAVIDGDNAQGYLLR